MVSEKLDNVDSETEEIPIAALSCARECRGKNKVIDVPSEDDELEIIGVSEPVVKKPKKMPVVPCVAWRTRLSRGKQERVSYSTYFQKNSDDSGDEKDDEKRDEDAVEEEEDEEESTSSDEDFDKSEPDVDLDDDMLIGEWQERYRAVKRKIVEPDIERDGTGFWGSESEGLVAGPPAKKLKSDNPDEVHVIESDLETDLDPQRWVLRSASSDSDWEEEIRYVPSSGDRSSSAGFRVNRNRLAIYSSKTQGSKTYARPYRQSITKDGSGSKFKLYKQYKGSSTRGRVPRGQDLMRMLVDRMSAEKGSGNWTVDPNQYGLKDVLPMVFFFEELEEGEKEKSEEDRELNELWADYEFALESENIGRYRNDEVQSFRIVFSLLLFCYDLALTSCAFF
jgi:DNA repair and recombination protein RAD54 and RAD54-like protein